ncbi:DUF2333 family protein [Desulfoluna spongiiphila]|uniref:DUF2333 domain-containing protein n=1 Tax=Desulfoluna spongiiphila TaxID=419481 RepID=A0A1G5BZY2_9BACT|nr:DUF2333 family protein [Desulfoluna spongiiphila]SCX95799.1 hypothetical protein SAMN05216233_102293 [Desulfoluna spongiiphila]VVS94025.1 consensus disorder prediction [Desulfoluna spongiiphila]
MSDPAKKKLSKEFKVYVFSRVGLAVIATLVVLWGGAKLFYFFTGSDNNPSPYHQAVEKNPTLKTADNALKKMLDTSHAADTTPGTQPHDSEATASAAHGTADIAHGTPADPHSAAPSHETAAAKDPESTLHVDTQGHEASTKGSHSSLEQDVADLFPNAVRGTAFVTALIEPLDYELSQRSLGWRPNDVFTLFTDNVENHQLGVLEVTRRTTEKLVERIARTGSTIKFDKNLNLARAKFNNDPKKYWLPAPEKSYAQAIEELKTYRERLNTNKATFHSRADNLIPLLSSYENLLGDCDDDLVKTHEESGAPVSTFKADDYFYYAQGVSSAMATILEAVMVDFAPVLDSRGAANDLHHAVLMLQHATELDPFVVQESDYSGFFANHRANMAAFISHARAYIQFVIKTMST